MTQHAVFSASGSHRWIPCPGSVELIKRVDFHEPSSPSAEEGTLAHEVLENIIKDFPIPEKADEDMIAYANEAIEYISNLVPLDPDNSEYRVTIDWLIKDQYGTADYRYYDVREKTLYVFDYKYGFNPVEVIGNTQMAFYAMDDATWKDVKNIVAVIMQPRAYHPDGRYRKWEFTREELMKIAVEFEKSHKLALLPNAPLETGSHCKYCKARGNCPAIHERINELKTILDADPPMTGEQLGERLANIRELHELVDYAKSSLETQAIHKMNSGETINGFSVVPNIGRRVLKDEKTLLSLAPVFGVDTELLYERKIKPLGKLEKELPKEIVNICTEQPNNGFKLVQSETTTNKAHTVFGEYK